MRNYLFIAIILLLSFSVFPQTGLHFFCGTPTVLEPMLAVTPTAVIRPGDSVETICHQESALFMMDSFPGKVFMLGEVNAIMDTLVALGNDSNCNNPLLSPSGKIMFVYLKDIGFMPPPSLSAWFNNGQMKIQLTLENMSDSIQDFALFRNNQFVSNFNGTMRQFTDNGGDPYMDHNYKLVINHKSGLVDSLFAFYSRMFVPTMYLMVYRPGGDSLNHLSLDAGNYSKTVLNATIFCDSQNIFQSGTSIYHYDISTIDPSTQHDFMLKALYVDSTRDSAYYHYIPPMAPRPQLYSYYIADSNAIMLDWSVYRDTVIGFDLYSSSNNWITANIITHPSPSERRYKDLGRSPDYDIDYMLVVSYKNGTPDTAYSHFTRMVMDTGTTLPLYCGLPNAFMIYLNTHPDLGYLMPGDSMPRPFARAGNPFVDSKHPGAVLIRGTILGVSDTMVALGTSGNCSDPLFDPMSGDVVFMRAIDYPFNDSAITGPPPYLSVRYDSSLMKIKLNLTNMPDSVQDFILYRDSQYVSNYGGTIREFVDVNGDPYISHNYKLFVNFKNSLHDSIFTFYSGILVPRVHIMVHRPGIDSNYLVLEAINYAKTVLNTTVLCDSQNIYQSASQISRINLFSTDPSKSHDFMIKVLYVDSTRDSAYYHYTASTVSRPQLHCSYVADSNAIILNWSVYRDTVIGFDLYSSSNSWITTILITHPSPIERRYKDSGRSPDNDVDYMLVVNYKGGTTDTAYSHFTKIGNTGSGISLYCGQPDTFNVYLNTNNKLTYIIPGDSTPRPFSKSGNPFINIKYPAAVLMLGTISGINDTMVALSRSGSCATPLFDTTTGSVIFIRLYDCHFNDSTSLQPPSLSAWFNNGPKKIQLSLVNMSDSIQSFALFRNNQFVSNYSGTIREFLDNDGDPYTDYNYMLVINHKNGMVDSLFTSYAGMSIQQLYLNVHRPGGDSLNYLVLEAGGYSKTVLNTTVFCDSQNILQSGGQITHQNLLNTDPSRPHGFKIKVLYADSTRDSANYYYMPTITPRPQLYSYYNPDSNAIILNWSVYRDTVLSFGVYYSMDGWKTSMIIGNPAGDIRRLKDIGRNPTNDFDYMLVVNYKGGTTDTAYSHFTKIGNTAPSISLYCGLPDSFGVYLNTHNKLAYIVPGDSSIKTFSKTGNPYFDSKYPSAVLLAGLISGIKDTMVALGMPARCAAPLFDTLTGSVIFMKVKDYPFYRGPQMNVYYSPDSGGIHIEWSGMRDTVSGFNLYRDNALLSSYSKAVRSAIDPAADPQVPHDYKLLISYTDNLHDTLYMHVNAFTPPNNIWHMPPFYCGDSAFYLTKIGRDIRGAAVYFRPSDSISRPFSVTGLLSRLPGRPEFIVLGKDSGMTIPDTFLVLGSDTNCAMPKWDKAGKLAFAKLYDFHYLRGPQLRVYYNPDSGGISLEWSGIRDTVLQFKLFRDNILVGPYGPTVRKVKDSSADPKLAHDYKLTISYTNNLYDTVYTHVNPFINGGNPWHFPPFYCGDSANYISKIGRDVRGTAVYYVPWDSSTKSFSVESMLSKLTGRQELFVLGRDSGMTGQDTFLVLGNDTNCAMPKFDRNGRIGFTRLSNFPFLRGQKLYVYYNIDSSYMTLFWGGMDRSKVDSFELFRDNSSICRTSDTTMGGFNDRIANPMNGHSYDLRVKNKDKSRYTLSASYAKPGDPYFSAWFSRDSGYIMVSWGNFIKKVLTYKIFRDNVLIKSFTGNSWSFIDRGAASYNSHSYMLVISYADSKSDTMRSSYTVNFKDMPPPFYCGTVTQLTDSLKTHQIAVVVPWDTTIQSAAITKQPFTVSSLPNKVILMGRVGSSSSEDTLIAYGSYTSCNLPYIGGPDKKIFFARLNDYPFIRGPRLMSWYYNDSNAVYLMWGGYTDTVLSYIMVRDGAPISSGLTKDITHYLDKSTDPMVSHTYMLLALKKGGRTDSLMSMYSPNGNGNPESNDNFSGLWMIEGGYEKNMANFTGIARDSIREGLGFHWNFKKDSLSIDSVTGAIKNVLTLTISLKTFTDINYKVFRTINITSKDSLNNSRLVDTSMSYGLYQYMAVMSYGARKDTVINYFNVGTIFTLNYGQSMTLDLVSFAKTVIGTTNTLAISSYKVNNTAAVSPTGNLYSYSNNVQDLNGRTTNITFKAGSKDVGFTVMAQSPFGGGNNLLNASPDPSSGYITLDGWINVELSGQDMDKGMSGTSSEPPSRNWVKFDYVKLNGGLTDTTITLPLDSGKTRLFTGSYNGSKTLHVKAIDSRMGLMVENDFGRIIKLGPTDKTVHAVVTGSPDALYYTVAEAVKAGKKNLRLGIDYKGMPFVLKGAQDVTITGVLIDTLRPIVDATGNEGGARLEDCKNVMIKGLRFKGGAFAVSAERTQGISMSQTHVTGSFCGFAGMGGGGSDTSRLGPMMRNASITNCIFEKIGGIGIVLDHPADCRVVNNTFIDNWAGVFAGKGGGNYATDTFKIANNSIMNNIFDGCKNGAIMVGKSSVADVIGLSILSNLFKGCDSGNVVDVNTNGPVLRITGRESSDGNTVADVSTVLFGSRVYPYVLSGTSLAINAGKRVAGNQVLFDFRGIPRIVSDSVDIGAIEIFTLTTGVNIITSGTETGYAKFGYQIVVPSDSGTLGIPVVSFKNNGLAFQPKVVKKAIIGPVSYVELYPLYDGAYSFTVSASYKSLTLDTVFTNSGSVQISGGSLTLPRGLWTMAGFADTARNIAKKNSCLMNLNDSTLYGWDSKSNTYTYLPNTGNMVLERGKSYWNMVDTTVTISLSKDLYSASDTSLFQYGLKQGWNMISSPFPFPVSAGRAVYVFNSTVSGYDSLDIIQPLKGAWLYSPKDTLLAIKYKPAIRVPALARSAKSLYRSRSDWEMVVTASVGALKACGQVVGINPNSLEGFDATDYPEPPAPINGIMAYFDNSTGSGYEKYLMKSYKPFAGTTLWSLAIDPRGHVGDIKLAFEGASNFDKGTYVYAGNPVAGFADIGKDSVLSIPGKGEKVYIVLAVTDNPNFVNDFTGVGELVQNKPNPFNPTTVISFHLPIRWSSDKGLSGTSEKVQLSVYDIRGSKVAILFSGPAECGKTHRIVWDAGSSGKELASGVYFYKLISGNFCKTRKMVLLR